jgi:hypothetical protein
VFFTCEASMQASIAATVTTITAGLFAVMISVLWSNRNSKVWEDTSEPGQTLGMKACHYGIAGTRCNSFSKE